MGYILPLLRQVGQEGAQRSYSYPGNQSGNAPKSVQKVIYIYLKST